MKPLSMTPNSTTDDLPIEELDGLIDRLREIRRRKQIALNLGTQLAQIIKEAEKNNLAIYGTEDCMTGQLKGFYIAEE